jgi:hypothetical protein
LLKILSKSSNTTPEVSEFCKGEGLGGRRKQPITIRVRREEKSCKQQQFVRGEREREREGKLGEDLHTEPIKG